MCSTSAPPNTPALSLDSPAPRAIPNSESTADTTAVDDNDTDTESTTSNADDSGGDDNGAD